MRFLAALVLAAPLLAPGSLSAQVNRAPADTRTTSIVPRVPRSGPLTIRVLGRHYVNQAPFAWGHAMICVGDSTDPRRYGVTQMLSDESEKTIDALPIGQPLLVTVYDEHTGWRTGTRVVRQMAGPGERLVVVLDSWVAGPTCSTPGRSKPLPGTGTRPYLPTSLVAPGGGLARTRTVELYNETGPVSRVIRFTGAPSHYRVSQRSDFAGAAWQPIQASHAMRALRHEITGSDGRKRIHFQMKNAAGTSPVYTLEVNFVELYACELKYARAPNAMQTMTMPAESLRVMRASSKTLDVAWPSANEGKPGYGMHLRWARNEGDHPIELTVGGGLAWSRVVLQPRDHRTFRADLKGVRCP